MTSVLAFRVEAPLISCGGAESFFTLRRTDLVPTKSQILCCLHNARGGRDTAAIPELVALRYAVREDLPATSILDDYQTVAGVPRSDRKGHEDQQVHKYYVCGTALTGFLQGPDDLLGELAEHWANPIRPIHWGRRHCVPSRPPVDDPATAVLTGVGLLDALTAVPLIADPRRPQKLIKCHIEVDPDEPLPEPTPLIRRVRDVPVGVLRDRLFAHREVYAIRLPRARFPEETIR